MESLIATITLSDAREVDFFRRSLGDGAKLGGVGEVRLEMSGDSKEARLFAADAAWTNEVLAVLREYYRELDDVSVVTIDIHCSHPISRSEVSIRMTSLADWDILVEFEVPIAERLACIRPHDSFDGFIVGWPSRAKSVSPSSTDSLIATVTLANSSGAAWFDERFRETIGKEAILHDHVRIESSPSKKHCRKAKLFVTEWDWANRVLLCLRDLQQLTVTIFIHCWQPEAKEHVLVCIRSASDWETITSFDQPFDERITLIRGMSPLRGFVFGVPRHVAENPVPTVRLPLAPSSTTIDFYPTLQPQMTTSETEKAITKLLEETADVAFREKLQSLGGKPWSAIDERLFAGRCRICRLSDAIVFTEECNHALLCPGCYADFLKKHRLMEFCLVCRRQDPTTRIGPVRWTEQEERELVGCCRACRRNEATWFTAECEHACYCNDCFESYFIDATECPICEQQPVVFIDIMKQ